MELAKPSSCIAAIATPPGRGGVGVVRVSGQGLADFAHALCGKIPLPRAATYAGFRDEHGELIDRGLLLYFPAPHSYTGEDVLELQGHGGPVVMQMLLKRCLSLGAKLAGPGEFTQRAFLNGKLDLAQAESVIDLIDASTDAAARSAFRSLSGVFSEAVHQCVAKLIDLRMLVEATLDFPDEEIDFLQAAQAFERIAALDAELAALLGRARQGSLLRTGMHVVLAGQPNVGKSSLLNQLAGEDRAIVTEQAGTTRDVVRERIEIEGIALHILDTAGLRETDDMVEKIGIAKTWDEIAKADIVLRMVDARYGISPEDHAIDARLPAGVPVLWLFNKCDLVGKPPALEEIGRESGKVLYLSAKQGLGIELLKSELLRCVGWSGTAEDSILARERHISALLEAAQHVRTAAGLSAQLDLLAEELRLAQEALNTITGEFGADDLLGVIFSRFCIGK